MGLHHVYQSHSLGCWMRAFFHKLWFSAPFAVLTILANPCCTISGSLVYIAVADIFICFAQITEVKSCVCLVLQRSYFGSSLYQNICIVDLTGLMFSSVSDGIILLCECASVSLFCSLHCSWGLLSPYTHGEKKRWGGEAIVCHFALYLSLDVFLMFA